MYQDATTFTPYLAETMDMPPVLLCGCSCSHVGDRRLLAVCCLSAQRQRSIGWTTWCSSECWSDSSKHVVHCLAVQPASRKPHVVAPALPWAACPRRHRQCSGYSLRHNWMTPRHQESHLRHCSACAVNAGWYPTSRCAEAVGQHVDAVVIVKVKHLTVCTDVC